jgi:hypothetical protein
MSESHSAPHHHQLYFSRSSYNSLHIPLLPFFQGSLPPRSTEEWEVEFKRYQQFPEWQQRQSMTLDEFKYIYFWEYGHRMMGRALGVAFLLPMGYFAVKKKIPKTLYPKLFGLLGLGASQVCVIADVSVLSCFC